LELGDPHADATTKVQTVGNYYADDQLTTDLAMQLAPIGRIVVMPVAPDLYNVDIGTGSYTQVSKAGLTSIMNPPKAPSVSYK
jgi:hypothetical protein